MKINMKNLKKSKLHNYVIKYHISHINYQLYFERMSYSLSTTFKNSKIICVIIYLSFDSFLISADLLSIIINTIIE